MLSPVLRDMMQSLLFIIHL